MLVLGREQGQSICVGEAVVTVVQVGRGGAVRLEIDCPEEMAVSTPETAPDALRHQQEAAPPFVLSRKQGQSICVGEAVVTVVHVEGGGKVRLGIDCPEELAVFRSENAPAPRQGEADATPGDQPPKILSSPNAVYTVGEDDIVCLDDLVSFKDFMNNEESYRQGRQVSPLDEQIKVIFSALPEDAGQRLEAVADRVDAFRVEAARQLQAALNSYLGERAEAQGPGSSVGRRNADDRLGYAEKEQIAGTVNVNLEHLGLAIDYRGHACNFAVTGGAKHGRFLLVPKGSKTPLLTRVNLSDFLPLTLVDASPRREGLAEWRQQEQARRTAAAHPAAGRE